MREKRIDRVGSKATCPYCGKVNVFGTKHKCKHYSGHETAARKGDKNSFFFIKKGA